MTVRVASRFAARPVLSALAPLVLVLVSSCGGDGGGGSPTAPPTPVTESFSGTSATLVGGSCSIPSSHTYQVAAGGSVQVRLDTSDDPTLRVQVCADGIDNNDCTINFTNITVGASVSGVRKGSQTQVLGFRRLGCTGGGPVVPGSIAYTGTITYQRP